MLKKNDVLSRAITSCSSWPDKEELLDVVYWSRQLLALVMGLLWGVLPLTGIIAIILYVAATTLALNFYVIGFQKQDIEEYGGFMEVAKEGFMSALATFLVMWIIVYTSMHFSS